MSDTPELLSSPLPPPSDRAEETILSASNFIGAFMGDVVYNLAAG